MHEAFVEGVPAMIDDFVKDIPNAKKDLKFLDHLFQASNGYW